MKDRPSNYTVALIKPDAVRKRIIHCILYSIENENYDVLFMKTVTFTREMAEEFYAEHKGKDFFNRLIDFTVSGPLVTMILRKENATELWRRDMNKIRNHFADKENPSANAVHGSDSDEAANRELKFLMKHKIIKEITYGK